MNTRLLLALGERWPASPECTWALLSPDNSLLEEGYSAPQGWPLSTSCDVMLCGPQVLWLECTLPALGWRKRRELPRLLAFALENHLLSDPSTQHLTLTHQLPDDTSTRESVGVLIVDKERLRTILEQLESLSRRPSQIVAELQTAPCDIDEWHLSVASHGATLRTSHQAGLAVDLGDVAPALARQYAQARPGRPDRVVVHLEPGCSLPDGEALGEDIHPPVVIETPYLWWQGVTRTADNLLHGEFGGGRSRNSQTAGLRTPAFLTLATVALALLVDFGEVFWLRNQHAALIGRMNGIYQTVFPGEPVVSPPARIRQQLSSERATRGLLRHDDALSLLAGFAEVFGAESHDGIVAMRFEDGVLDLTLTGALQVRMDELVTALGAHGFLGTVRNNVDPPHLLIRPEVY